MTGNDGEQGVTGLPGTPERQGLSSLPKFQRDNIKPEPAMQDGDLEIRVGISNSILKTEVEL